MLVLALDTSTPDVTVGVCRLGSTAGQAPVPSGGALAEVAPAVEVLASRVTPDARAHAELATPHVVGCLREARVRTGELGAVVVGCGPGPFTGLRVGMATAAAFADALGVPLHGVCSLDALAARALRGAMEGGPVTGDLLVVTDARRREAYHCRYAPDGARSPGSSPSVGPAAGIDTAGVAAVAGDPGRVAELVGLWPGVVEDDAVRAPDPAGLVTVVARDLLEGVDPRPVEPLYLRRPDAVPPRPTVLSAAFGDRS